HRPGADPVPPAPSREPRRRPEHGPPRARRDLVARDVGLAGRPLRLAARLVGRVPARPGVGPAALRPDPPRPPLHRRLLGLSPGPGGPAVRPGLLRATALRRAELRLHADRRAAGGLPGLQPVRPPVLPPVLFRRLLRAELLPGRHLPVVLVPP